MYADISKPPKPSPVPHLERASPGLSLLPPLSRRGRGPAIVLLVPDNEHQLVRTGGTPSQTLKWAEEGFVVAELQATALATQGAESLQRAVAAAKACDQHDGSDRVGLVAYSAQLWNQIAAHLPVVTDICGAVVYAGAEHVDSLAAASVPLLRHVAGPTAPATPLRSPALTTYGYPTAPSQLFALPFASDFTPALESMAHSRSLAFLKPLVGGPYFDLEAIWEEHCHYEFVDRSVEHTMSTMVDDAYVNNIPVLTGGIGRAHLSEFYRAHFIFSNSADSELELISRTVGIDRVIDEFIFKVTHDREIGWLVPGIPPTGVRLEVPVTAVVNIRGDRLYHEHIAWDQATVLRQLGLLPDYLPYPRALPDGRRPAPGMRFEYRVPAAGAETAHQLRDKNHGEMNEMLSYVMREVPDTS